LSHNLGSRYVSKPIKGSKGSDDTLDSKTNLSQTNGLLGWYPRQVKLAKKAKTCPNTRLPESVESLNRSLAQLPGELWCCKALKMWIKGKPCGTESVLE